MLTLLLGNRMLNSVATASSDICDETRNESLSFVLNSNSYGVSFSKGIHWRYSYFCYL